jgi:hypothetical protein
MRAKTKSNALFAEKNALFDVIEFYADIITNAH